MATVTQRHIYLSGAMTGVPEFNFPAFNEAAAAWRACGYRVTNPAEGFNGKTDLPRNVYLREDILILVDDREGLVDAVAVLPGWQASQGASLEVSIARALSIPVLDARFPEGPVHYYEPPEQQARRIVGGDRNKAYGSAYENFTDIARVWEGILRIQVTAAQVGLCMIGVKLAREGYRPSKDNIVDAIGYSLCVDQIRDVEERQRQQWQQQAKAQRSANGDLKDSSGSMDAS